MKKASPGRVLALKAKVSPRGSDDTGDSPDIEIDTGSGEGGAGGGAGEPGLEALPEAISWLDGLMSSADPEDAQKIGQAIELLKSVGGAPKGGSEGEESPAGSGEIGAGAGVGATQ